MSTADMHREIARLAAEVKALEQERDELAAQVEAMRSALQFYMDFGITEPLYYTVRDALALQNTSAGILRQRDARTLREAADMYLRIANEDASQQAVVNSAFDCEFELRLVADELGRKPLRNMTEAHGG